MSEIFQNAIKRQADQMDTNRSHPQQSLVASYDPATARVRVFLQPENVLTGWLPMNFPMVGPGIGLICPPYQGQQVLVTFEGGDRGSGVVMGGTYSNQSLPPNGYNNQPAQSGEIALISGTAGTPTFVHILANGDIQVSSATKLNVVIGDTVFTVSPSGVSITGNLLVDGTITATEDVLAGPNKISSVNHPHINTTPGDGLSGPPQT